jgi:branched-chain amino acid transport system ATP-binding protein
LRHTLAEEWNQLLLEINHISAYYGPIQALWNVSLNVDKGEIVTLIGCNGAGKTTLLKSIAGLVAAKGGCIKYRGKEITGAKANQLVAKGIVLCPEGRKIFPRMTVWENLRMGGFTRKKEDLEGAFKNVCELFPILKERMNQQGATLSGGEQQMLAIGRSLMADPKLLLLDEPSLGLSPILTEKIFKLIMQIRNQGITVLLVEQNAVMGLSISDRGYVMETGKILYEGTSTELLHKPEVMEAYLGCQKKIT